MINVFMGAALYLIISLKLERSASEFREKKLRKEMDEIIKEFNATADRNISILENRINVLKRLLERTGDLKSLDFTIDDEGIEKSSLNSAVVKEQISEKIVSDNSEMISSTSVSDHHIQSGVAGTGDVKKRLLLYTENVIDIIRFYFKKFTGGQVSPPNIPIEFNYGSAEKVDLHISDGDKDSEEICIEKDFSDISQELSRKNEEIPSSELTDDREEERVLDDDLSEIFAGSSDKYGLISQLHKEGHPIEMLSKHSGIPAGEIRLVLNLNNS